MSENMSNLIEVVKYMEKRGNILEKMLVHLGCRADLYDSFIINCFNELENLKAPKLKDIDK